jgi:hypothetical protein
MANRPQKIKLCRDLAMYFAEKGKIMTQDEYIKQDDKPVMLSGIRNVGRSYSRAIEMMKGAHPELMTLIEKKKAEAAIKTEPKPAPAPAPKPALKRAAVKPAVKPAVKKD